MHPAFDALYPDVPLDPPSSLIGGEALLARIYDAIRSASTAGGSNAWNTLLLVTFDEHGGTYDHVPPVAAPAPDPAAPPGQMGFTFTRTGLRVPAVAISAWIPGQTVVAGEHWNTSVIRTLRERWGLGPALTARDAAARDLAPVLSLDSPRAPEDWPDVFPRPVPPFDPTALSPDAQLRSLPRVALFGVLALAKSLGMDAPDLAEDEDITHADGVEIIVNVFGHMFPGLHSSRWSRLKKHWHI
jgi:phospholipase C